MYGCVFLASESSVTLHIFSTYNFIFPIATTSIYIPAHDTFTSSWPSVPALAIPAAAPPPPPFWMHTSKPALHAHHPPCLAQTTLIAVGLGLDNKRSPSRTAAAMSRNTSWIHHLISSPSHTSPLLNDEKRSTTPLIIASYTVRWATPSNRWNTHPESSDSNSESTLSSTTLYLFQPRTSSPPVPVSPPPPAWETLSHDPHHLCAPMI